MYQGKLTGILYLENNLVTGAFTPERLKILQLLTAQVAISIENAALYTNLEQQVQERTAQLQQSLTFEATLKRITDRVRDSLDENQILETTVQELAQVLGVMCCDAGIYDSEHKTSTICYEYRTTVPSVRGRTFQMDDESAIYAQLLQGRSFQFCFVVQEASRLKHQFAMLTCPIRDNKSALGDLWLFKPKEGTFDEQEVRLVQQVANQCAIAIRQARLYQSAQTQVQALEELNQLKDDFLSTVSHELRTPISNMKMAIYMLKQIPDPERQQRYLNILQSECAREVELINDLLDLQRLLAGNKSFEPEIIQLQDWIPPILEPFDERIQSRQQSLQVTLAPDLPLLTTDPASLGRIVSELLNNACKYTPPEGQITVNIDRVENSQMQDNQVPAAACFPSSILIQVSNSGVEIPAEELPRIFEKFYRIPGSDRWKQGGTGLGLALVQKLVEHLGAEICVESTANLTCFIVKLPIEQI
ncbi:ATP-binding protein [Leptolyngbya sp. FACHB-671]|uniref:GAF domain-containing sensor histidine kinase n=1 Tax=Leptolyngbya sp. FACHB-671 TaxID=2692812 RepID=UPI0032204C22